MSQTKSTWFAQSKINKISHKHQLGSILPLSIYTSTFGKCKRKSWKRFHQSFGRFKRNFFLVPVVSQLNARAVQVLEVIKNVVSVWAYELRKIRKWKHFYLIGMETSFLNASISRWERKTEPNFTRLIFFSLPFVVIFISLINEFNVFLP